ncbi:uncharacterized protein A4U43_C02F2670 [Asparagus officinalis]|uniref:sphingosine kinase n=1 Tax=Asparagus officinalis TaxID=4686 RepID=A0A5P1FJE9_ASPOF|nr:sphingosine kinase 2-like isoform X2 [Asparagus officinalis]ONK77059.1 uncharacterized protein A4U43_C02F2670 [Asparagus officinalis]
MAGKSETKNGALTGRIRINGSDCEASLSPGGVLTWQGEGERSLAMEQEALGFGIEEGRRIRVRGFSGDRKRRRKDFVLEMESDEMVGLWSERLKDCFDSFGRPKRLFVVLNPFGGKKNAREIFQNEIKPLLTAADIIYTLQETRYQLHAQEIAYKLDILKYDGIVCVSGDGVLVEVVNGLLQREDWDSAIKVPLGIIPAGTGNGMAKSLLDAAGEAYSISNAVFSVLRGHKRALDVSTVMQGVTKFFSVLMLTWGFVADVDIGSEKYRWMGSTARFQFYFVPAPGYEEFGEPLQRNFDSKAFTSVQEQGQGNGVLIHHGGYQGPSVCFDSREWRSLDGPFISVWLNNVPWSDKGTMPAPQAKFSDGYLDMVITRDCPKSALLALMLQLADGSHLKSPYVIYLKVKAFQLEPGQRVGNASKGGIVDSDGEVLARGDGTYECHKRYGDLMMYGSPIEMFVDQGLATIFSPR